MEEHIPNTIYAFDLDGTVTLDETLPLLANELGLSDEMSLLTKLTLDGQIAFDKSFKLRYHILKSIPIQSIQNIMRKVRFDPAISKFIEEHSSSCTIVTGNLDIWIRPILEKLKCRCYSSTSSIDEKGVPILEDILDKGEAIRDLRKKGFKVIAIGESFNDVPMFEESNVSIAYGGVHRPVNTAIAISDYVVMEGNALCRLLKML